VKRAFLAAASAVALAAAAVADETKILLIGKDPDHPYGTHMYMFECELLARCLRQSPGVHAVVSNGWPEDPAVLEGVDVIVCYSAESGTYLLGGKHRREFERMMADGVGLVALHWSTGAAPGEIGERWRDLLGGWFHTDFSRLDVREATVRQATSGDPINRGWRDFPLRDEYYLDLRFREDVTPIAQVDFDGKPHTIAWTYARPDGGRSFGFVCGHFHDVFLTTGYRQAVVNGILWCAKRDIPVGGAPCEVTKAEGTLPPKSE
jgi:type 1 glutamine amidotransferase